MNLTNDFSFRHFLEKLKFTPEEPSGETGRASNINDINNNNISQ